MLIIKRQIILQDGSKQKVFMKTYLPRVMLKNIIENIKVMINLMEESNLIA